MKWLAVTLSSFIVVLGAIGVVWPAALLGIARSFGTPSGLYVAAALRIVFGVALFVSAPASRAPGAIRTIGIVVFVAGLMTPLIGPEAIRGVVDWWSTRSSFFLHAVPAFPVALGGFLAWALLSKSGRDAS
jgi:hypothetical protein